MPVLMLHVRLDIRCLLTTGLEGASHKGSLLLVLLLQRQLAGQSPLEMALIRAEMRSGDRDACHATALRLLTSV